MSENRCISCGEIIPEGRQVCLKCEVKQCGFDNLVPCTRKCIYYNTCTRNPYKYGADQKEKEVSNERSKR